MPWLDTESPDRLSIVYLYPIAAAATAPLVAAVQGLTQRALFSSTAGRTALAAVGLCMKSPKVFLLVILCIRVRPGKMQRLCTGTLVHYEQTVRKRVARPGRRMQRVCTGALSQYEQLARLS